MSAFAQTSFETVRGFALPRTLGPFSLGSVIDNERDNPGLGSTVLYNAPGVKASVYIYDFGIRKLPDGIESDSVKKHFNDTKASLRTAFPTAQVIVEDERMTVKGLRLLHAAYQYTEGKAGSRKSQISHLYLGSHRGNFIKLRVSYSSVDQPDRGDKSHISFVEDLCKSLTK